MNAGEGGDGGDTVDLAGVDIARLAVDLGARLVVAGARVATVESCTGGGVACAITAVAGASAWFERGWVTYANAAKTELVGVPAELIQRHGAVSAEVAAAMAEGGLRGGVGGGGDGGDGDGDGGGDGGLSRYPRSRLSGGGGDYCIAVTGVAGPGGGTKQKPVGTVYFGWAGRGMATATARANFSGNRESIRRQSIARALAGLVEFMPLAPA